MPRCCDDRLTLLRREPLELGSRAVRLDLKQVLHGVLFWSGVLVCTTNVQRKKGQPRQRRSRDGGGSRGDECDGEGGIDDAGSTWIAEKAS
jgi:hypothetical protein